MSATHPSCFEKIQKERVKRIGPIRAGCGSHKSRKATHRLFARFVPLAAALADVAIVLGTTALISICYETNLLPINDLAFGALLAVLYLAINITRHNYALSAYLRIQGQARCAVRAWCIAFLAAITIAFFTKTGSFFSRGMAVLVFAAGSMATALVRVSLSRAVIGMAERGCLTARSVFIVGDETAVGDFSRRSDATGPGLRVAGAAVIRTDPSHRSDDLALAAATARVLRPDDILILAPWSDAALIGRCINTFMSLPAAVHIGPDALLENFADMHVVRNGPLTCVRLVQTPLSPLQRAVKRGFDIVVAIFLVALLSPLLAMVALLIRFDSRGPVLFRQTRYGYNREPFRIVKFRTMTTLEDGAAVRQATKNDARITRVGRILRQTNLDELPQLVNVIRGEMSLVGPRPHAVAHDQAFEGEIVNYARRHNVRPGITGWAQVNGWRGETETSEKMAGRIAMDLHYVDNWSLWLDCTILVRTVLSSRAYLNAA